MSARRGFYMTFAHSLAHTTVFLRATCDIEAGEELLVTYGSTYHALHFPRGI